MSFCDASPLVARALRKADEYANGYPTWPKAPRARDAKKARKKAAKRLRRFVNGFPDADQLANVLKHCRPNHRCMSGACPECGRALQRWFVANLDALRQTTALPLYRISIALADYQTPEDRLHTLHTTGMKRALAYVLGKVPGIAWAAGGIDLSLNDETQKGSNVAWLPQFYGFVAIADAAVLTKSLRKRYPTTDQAPRPVHIKLFNGNIEAFSYALKPVLMKRIAYKDSLKNRWDTRKVYLSPREHVQAMLWMHNIGLSSRLFLKNVRMTRVGQHVKLVKIKQLK